MAFPKNIIEFEKMFSDEKQCEEYLINLRWTNGFKCQFCSHNEYWLLSRHRIGCKFCKNKFSITSNTIFEQSNKPLSLWYRAIWLMIAQKNGISALGLQRLMGFGSYLTAWTWLHKLRILTVLPDRARLNGKIEVDETYLGGKKKGKRGRGAEGKIPVIIAVEIMEVGTGRVRLSLIKDVKRKSLRGFIESNIENGSELITDDWRAYKKIEGYKHTISNDTIFADDEEILPNVHRVAALLKRWLLGTHQQYIVGGKTQNYLDEFTFRYNRRKSLSRGLLFQRVMEQAIKHEPVLYSDINKSSIIKGKYTGGKF
jgi:transposase-like protein